jgi:hypothetical protein
LSPLHPIDFGINPYNDDVDLDGDDGMLSQIKPLPSLDAGILLCVDFDDAVTSATVVTTAATPNVAGAVAAATANADGAVIVTANVDGAGATTPDAAPRLPSGQMQHCQ